MAIASMSKRVELSRFTRYSTLSVVSAMNNKILNRAIMELCFLHKYWSRNDNIYYLEFSYPLTNAAIRSRNSICHAQQFFLISGHHHYICASLVKGPGDCTTNSSRSAINDGGLVMQVPNFQL